MPRSSNASDGSVVHSKHVLRSCIGDGRISNGGVAAIASSEGVNDIVEAGLFVDGPESGQASDEDLVGANGWARDEWILEVTGVPQEQWFGD